MYVNIACCPVVTISSLQTKTYVSDEILRMEPDEALEKLADAEKMCKVFVDVYNDRRKNLATYFKDGPVVDWDFQSNIVFTRFDKFMAQIRQLQARKYLYCYSYMR